MVNLTSDVIYLWTFHSEDIETSPSLHSSDNLKNVSCQMNTMKLVLILRNSQTYFMF